ncbi:MAG: glycosyltransferase family 39 protein [Solirubrobacterales bacterium]|nr:glycosyltransferase family 39 protein [Solirubrobacterales bacterium]
MSTTTFPRRVSPVQGRAGGRLRSLVRGRAEDPAWARPALLGLLIATAVAYLWNVTASGEANSFYAAAVQAMTKSWKALFFGSLDSSNFITVDKPPASLWVMALSSRLFGFSSASMLVPQVLEGVLAVGLLAATVKRWFGTGAGLLAGGLLAATPAAALMFRFNNPDALLVCLLVGSAYCLVRALEGASSRWILAMGALIGFAFLAKMMQAFLVVPGFALVYLIAAPTSVHRRAGQLLAAGAAMVLSAGWWVTIVALWPVSSRPMIDGSPDNSILNLILGYNGFGRLTGAGGGGGFSGQPGLLRLFNDLMGGQASWLLPAALLVLGAGLVWRLRAARTDRVRAALLLWGGWLVVTGLVFSLASGVIHTYYTVALAPAIAALVAIGVALVWRRREQPAVRALLAVGVGITAAWSLVLLGRTSAWEPWLTPVVAVASVSAVAALLAPAPTRRLRTVGALLALVAFVAAPVAYSAQTIASPHTGSVPSAGPEIASANGLGAGASGGTRPTGAGAPPGAGAGVTSRTTTSMSVVAGPGGGASETSSALISLLKERASGYRWAAATYGSQTAASLELATGGVTVMAIGGFNGQGGNLSLAQFEAYVRAGDIHYFIVSGGGAGTGGPGGASATSAITSWVEAHYKAKTVGGQTVYDLTQPTS